MLFGWSEAPFQRIPSKKSKFIERTETVNKLVNTFGYAPVYDKSTVENMRRKENCPRMFNTLLIKNYTARKRKKFGYF